MMLRLLKPFLSCLKEEDGDVHNHYYYVVGRMSHELVMRAVSC